MTATVTHWQGIELARGGHELEVGADEQSFAIQIGWAAPRPAGTLWERVADHHSFLAVVMTERQWERIAAIRSELGTHSGRVDVRGETLRDLQRRDAARYYVHTGFECGAL